MMLTLLADLMRFYKSRGVFVLLFLPVIIADHAIHHHPGVILLWLAAIPGCVWADKEVLRWLHVAQTVPVARKTIATALWAAVFGVIVPVYTLAAVAWGVADGDALALLFLPCTLSIMGTGAVAYECANWVRQNAGPSPRLLRCAVAAAIMGLCVAATAALWGQPSWVSRHVSASGPLALSVSLVPVVASFLLRSNLIRAPHPAKPKDVLGDGAFAWFAAAKASASWDYVRTAVLVGSGMAVLLIVSGPRFERSTASLIDFFLRWCLVIALIFGSLMKYSLAPLRTWRMLPLSGPQLLVRLFGYPAAVLLGSIVPTTLYCVWHPGCWPLLLMEWFLFGAWLAVTPLSFSSAIPVYLLALLGYFLGRLLPAPTYTIYELLLGFILATLGVAVEYRTVTSSHAYAPGRAAT